MKNIFTTILLLSIFAIAVPKISSALIYPEKSPAQLTNPAFGMCTAPLINAFSQCNILGKDTLNIVSGDIVYDINFDWGTGSPNSNVPGDNFSVRWNGDFNFKDANYQFSINSLDNYKLTIDGQLIVDKWVEFGTGNYIFTKLMSSGRHNILLEYYENSGTSSIKFDWKYVSPNYLPPATNTSTPLGINTLTYFLDTNSNKELLGTHNLGLTVNAQKAYYVKWNSDSFENYTWDDNYIYIKEDHSGSPVSGSYTYSDGRWLKRYMNVGDSIVVNNNQLQFYTGDECTPTITTNFPYKVTLESHFLSYNMGGDIGVQDVIVLKYDYSNGTSQDFERSYYSSQWGWVKWELYRAGVLIQSSVFNQVLDTSPTPPNVPISCLNKPATVTVPVIPTTLSGLVSHMYSCVLKNNIPDQAGFNYWLNNLQNKYITVPQFYTYIFNTQSGFSNADFVNSLYNCVLFKMSDGPGFNYWLSILDGNLDSRANQLQYFLQSGAFQTDILPKLQILN